MSHRRVALLAFIAMPCLVSCQRQQTEKPKEPAQIGKGGPVASVSAVLSLGTEGTIGVEARAAEKDPWSKLELGQPLAFGSMIRVPKGTRARVQLEGGSLLLLNQKTEVELASQGLLKVKRGELLAKVQPSSDKTPLLIETPTGKIKVTGTKFNLQVGPAITVVDVTRGSVEVEGAGSNVQVGAGERGEVGSGKRPRVSLSQDLVETTRWTREILAPRRDVQQLEQGFGSLTARVPGQGKSRSLRLSNQQVRVVVRDNIARTEVEQVFHNSSSQTLEGTYRFPLPAGASISRLALYVGKNLMEGEIVERHRARRIFNKIVNDTIRPRDPALLEWVGGRTFQMKIFPIPPRSSRRVILGYTQPLTASYGRYRYVYPMSTSKGKATRINRFGIEMKVSSSRGLDRVETPLYPVLKEQLNDGVRLRYEANNFTPAASFVANFRAKGAVPEMTVALYEKGAGVQAMASRARPACAVRGRRRTEIPSSPFGVVNPCGDRGGFFMAILRPELPSVGKAKRQDYLFLMDSSYSTGKQGWAVQTSVLEAFLAEMDLHSRFNVMACDERCRKMGDSFRKPDSRARREALTFVRGLTVGGSSNLQAAFERAARLSKGVDRPLHVVYLGDGRPTAGEMREPQLAKLVVDQLSRARVSLSALQIGEDVGELFLEEATRRLSGSIHRLDAGDDLRSRVFEVVAAQYRPTLSDLEVSFEGFAVHDVYPRRLPALTAGSETVLVGRYDRGGNGAVLLRGTVDGKPFERRYPVALHASVQEQAANKFIPRLWAQHHLDALSVDAYSQNRPEIVRVSKAYTVLSRATAFLVLENERMYREFRVKRKRNRDYWKGDKVSTRTLSDRKGEEPETTAANKDADEEAKSKGEAGPLGGLDSIGSRGRAASGASATPAAEREEKRSMARSRVFRRPRAPAKSAPRADFANPYDSSEDAPPKAAEPEPSAQPLPVAKPKPRPMPRRRARRSKKRPALTADPFGDGGGGGSGYYRRVRRVPVHSAQIVPIIDVRPNAAKQRRVERLRRRVEAQPLRRTTRRAYHRALVTNSRYDLALTHARKWAEVDGSRPDALLALADMQAAAGDAGLAKRTYSSTVDVQPWSVRLHRTLAQMYWNKGELELSCAHRWSIMSIFPKQVKNHLDLAACLADLPSAEGRQLALKILTDLANTPQGRRKAARIGKALANIDQHKEKAKADRRRRLERGTLVVRATWNRPVDLDLALVTPRGQRITALSEGRRGGVIDSRDGASAELLGLRWAGNGHYRVEIAHAAGTASGPINGTVLIKVRGKTQTIPFIISGRSKPLARLELSTKYKRVPSYY